MKKLKNFFKFLPAMCLALLSGLSVVLFEDHKLNPTYAEDLSIFTYDDTQDFTYSSGPSTSVRLITKGFSQIVQDSVTHQYQLSYHFRINNIYVTYNNITIQALPVDTSNFVGNVFYSGYLDDDGTLPPYQDRDFNLSLKKITTVGASPSVVINPSNKTLSWQDVTFTFTYSIAGYTGSNLNELTLFNYGNPGSHSYIRFNVSSSISDSTLRYMYLRSYNNIDRTLVDIDYPDNLSAYEQGYLAGSRDGYDEGYLAGQQSGYNNGTADGYANGYYQGTNDGYQSGFIDGEQSGYASGNADGQATGYSDGYTAGYNDGFTADTTASTIFSGILQVGMLPVNVLLAIFNFEILGINLSAFISAILTVCLTVIVIRTIKGGSN